MEWETHRATRVAPKRSEGSRRRAVARRGLRVGFVDPVPLDQIGFEQPVASEMEGVDPDIRQIELVADLGTSDGLFARVTDGSVAKQRLDLRRDARRQRAATDLVPDVGGEAHSRYLCRSSAYHHGLSGKTPRRHVTGALFLGRALTALGLRVVGVRAVAGAAGGQALTVLARGVDGRT